MIQIIKKIANPAGEDLITRTVQPNFQNNIRMIDFLGLANTQITDTTILGFQSIFDSAGELDPKPRVPPRSLLRLDISRNNITENGLLYLAELIKEKRLISHLNVSKSAMLREDFLEHFLSVLRSNSSLMVLDYSGIRICQQSLYRILNFVYRNKFIVEFKVTAENKVLRSLDLKRFHNRLRCFGFEIEKIWPAKEFEEEVRVAKGEPSGKKKVITQYDNMQTVREARRGMTKTFND